MGSISVIQSGGPVDLGLLLLTFVGLLAIGLVVNHYARTIWWALVMAAALLIGVPLFGELDILYGVAAGLGWIIGCLIILRVNWARGRV